MANTPKVHVAPWISETAYITVAALVGIAVVGRVTATDTYKRAEGIPFVGPFVLRPLRALAYQTFNP